jgi:hypothetical protein
MRFPIIKVRDKATGRTHIVGTNTHDVLLVENGIHYYNLQSGCGTGKDGSYAFIGNRDESLGVEVEFVSLEELLRLHEETEKEARERENQRQKILSDLQESWDQEE